MRLLRFPERSKQPTVLHTKRLMLRRPEPADFKAWSALRAESRDFLQPFEPTWARDELSITAWRARMRRHEAEISQGRSLPWFLFDRDDTLVGGLTLSNIRRGVADTGTLGYWMGERFAGAGYMSEAVRAVAQDVFTTHKLHRIEAAALPDNTPSLHLLRRCHFREEGRARGYLRIDGAWHDHVLFARLATDPADEAQ